MSGSTDLPAWCTPLYFSRQTGWAYETVKACLTGRRQLAGQLIEGAEFGQEEGLLGAVGRWRIPVAEISRLRRRSPGAGNGDPGDAGLEANGGMTGPQEQERSQQEAGDERQDEHVSTL